jgi:hypothetical protein
VAEVGDAGRVAVRLSPPNTDAGEPREAGDLEDPDALYAHAIKALDAFGLAYLLLTELRWFGGVDGGKGWDALLHSQEVRSAACTRAPCWALGA